MSAPLRSHSFLFFFFFNDTATTEIYTLSLHDALPILLNSMVREALLTSVACTAPCAAVPPVSCHSSQLSIDRKSTRLNSSHTVISYAVFCLKKKKNTKERYSSE